MEKFFTAWILALDFQLGKTILSTKINLLEHKHKKKNKKGVPP